MSPTHQCFKPHDLASTRIDDRLVMKEELAVAHPLEHRGLHGHVVLGLSELLMAVYDATRLAGFLCAVHGGIRMGKQLDLAVPMLREHCGANRCTDI